MKQTLIAMILITLLFSGCSHKSPNPPIQEPPLTTTQKVAGTAGGILWGVAGAISGGMLGFAVSGDPDGIGPIIGVIVGGALGIWEGYTIGTILTE